MTVFGGSALYIEIFGGGGIADAVTKNIPVSLFVLLEKFPFSFASSILGVLVIVSFFVTSSDSGSMVIDIITAGGNPDPPVPQRLFWAILEGVVAGALLLGGGLAAFQSAVVATGLPFGIVLLVLCFSLKKGLNEYTGVQTFSVKRAVKGKPVKFQIESADAPFVVFEKKKKKGNNIDA